MKHGGAGRKAIEPQRTGRKYKFLAKDAKRGKLIIPCVFFAPFARGNVFLSSLKSLLW